MTTYEIAYTPAQYSADSELREYETYTNKQKCLKRANELAEQGVFRLFIDIYEGTKNDEFANLVGGLKLDGTYFD